MKKFLKESGGFTLVELMVVVAIIGILSAVAIPNFKKYQAKSKQSEAKIQLAALYSAEVTANSDYDTYGTCIATMGYEQVQRGYYVVGFTSGFNATGVNSAFAGCTASDTYVFNPAVQHLNAVASNMPTTIAGTTAADQNSFTAGAEASISNSGAAQDRWTINQAKLLSNTAVGY